MSHRTILRRAALLTVAVGAVLAPTAAVASDSPEKSRGALVLSPKESPAPAAPRGGVAAGAATPSASPTLPSRETPKVSLAEGDRAVTPRGGVAAGERPVEQSGSPALIGSAAGLVLLAGAGAVVVRRRVTAARPTV
ncbi:MULTISPECIES: hypothetical protein [unclassified Streptomyces]|uniref:hypothetical protein n=1 Tax=Streptomyces sp. NPDC005955 TaxID=3364738 RepID=UPI00369B7EA2